MKNLFKLLSIALLLTLSTADAMQQALNLKRAAQAELAKPNLSGPARRKAQQDLANANRTISALGGEEEEEKPVQPPVVKPGQQGGGNGSQQQGGGRTRGPGQERGIELINLGRDIKKLRQDVIRAAEQAYTEETITENELDDLTDTVGASIVAR